MRLRHQKKRLRTRERLPETACAEEKTLNFSFVPKKAKGDFTEKPCGFIWGFERRRACSHKRCENFFVDYND